MMPIREMADSWASLYANSATLRSVVSFAHLGGLLSGGGYAVATDLNTLSALRRGADLVHVELRSLRRVHRVVVGSLVVIIASGVLLMLADLDAYLASTAFWIKMALVVALGLNGAALICTGALAADGNRRALARLRLASLLSLALWFGTTLVGAVLPNAL